MTERLPDSPTPHELSEFVNQHVLENQTLLVNHLLNIHDEANEFSPETIANFYRLEGEDDAQECGDPQEIYEWWVVSNWLIRQLKNRGEPVLINAYGTWWGRTCTGQAVYLDSVIQEICTENYQSNS